MREILFRGQTRKYGEKVKMNGEKIKSNWVYGGIFPQNEGGDFAIIYQQEPTVENIPFTQTQSGSTLALRTRTVLRFLRGILWSSLTSMVIQHPTKSFMTAITASSPLQQTATEILLMILNCLSETNILNGNTYIETHLCEITDTGVIVKWLDKDLLHRQVEKF